MGKINILSKDAAEKIAAGEVVERPANAIKEMVENSIDAGAKSVVVEIRRGGISYIRVTDDGIGIMPEDMEKAFMRHATSKIKDIADLEHISTLGFRGEALCSIASVSHCEMTSKPPQCDLGTRIVIEGGETKLLEETGCPNGTTIVVQELFFNTPARMKFLKKDSAEGAYVADVCQKQALSHPEVSIRLLRDGREAFFTPGNNDLSDAVRCIWGKDFSRNMGEIKYQIGGIRVTGLGGKNNLSRPNRMMQLFFVNGRSVQNKVLSMALAEAYKNELMGGRFPVAVINIELNPALCDVNVHPAKTEIKFADEQSVYTAVYWAVKNMIASQAGAREAEASFVREGASFKLPAPSEIPKQLTVKSASKFRQYEAPPKDAIPREESPAHGKSVVRSSIDPILPKKTIERLNKEHEEKLKSGEATPPVIINTGLFNVPPEAETTPKAEKAPPPEPVEVRIIGQLFSTYILAEGSGELLLVDQHAAHERVRYEELRRLGGKISPQLLILPLSVSLSPEEFAAVSENRDFLENLGFDFDASGENTVMLRSIPSDCFGDEGDGLFVELAGDLSGSGKGPISERKDRALYTVACKSAIKANKELSESEMQTLIGRALAMEGISTCPHGRPISVKITRYQIEKMFKRIV